MRIRLTHIRDWTFWHYQITGWLVFSAGNLAVNIHAVGWNPRAVASICLQLVVAVLLTLGLRLWYRRLPHRELSLPAIVSRIVLYSFLATVLLHGAFLGIETLIFGKQFLAKATAHIAFSLQWIAFLFPVMLAWSALYFGIKFYRDWTAERIRVERATEEAQHAQLQALRYQLNPHFLFNTLNSVRALVDEDSRQAKQMVTDLAEFLRYSLVSRNKTELTLSDELNAVHLYLSIEQRRYEDKLSVAFEIDPEAGDVPMPSFLIHPIVQNAVKYGLRTSQMPLQIRVSARCADHMLRIDIANSGTWIEPTDVEPESELEFGAGLENVRARLQEAYPGHHRLTIEEKDGFVHVTLEIPQKTGSPATKPPLSASGFLSGWNRRRALSEKVSS